MASVKFWVLPLLTLLVFFLSYQLNLFGYDGKKHKAFHEACWWGGGFFIYGLADYLLLGLSPF